jgi:hypothetical protein
MSAASKVAQLYLYLRGALHHVSAEFAHAKIISPEISRMLWRRIRVAVRPRRLRRYYLRVD